MEKVYIIGIGSGIADYLLPIAKREIERADCLIGAKRLLNLFSGLNKEKIQLEGHFNAVLDYIKENRHKRRIAVLVSGDPGLYSFLGQISGSLSREEYTVIPGISAVQLAFAKIGETWHDAKIISLHGRKFGGLAEEVKAHPKIFLFTDLSFPPEKIAAYLLDQGIKNKRAIVFENLTYPDERIVDTDLERLSKMNPALSMDSLSDSRKSGVKGFGLCVMIIKK